MDELLYEMNGSFADSLYFTGQESAEIGAVIALSESATPIADVVDSISTVAESVAAALEGIVETIQEIVNSIDLSVLIDSLLNTVRRIFSKDRLKKLTISIRNSTLAISYAFLHWMMSGGRSFRRKLKGQRRLLYALIIKAAILYPCVKALVIAFFERTMLILSINLHRIQARGTSEDSEGNCLYIVTC